MTRTMVREAMLLATASVLLGSSTVVHAQVPVRAIGPVTEVWAKDERYERYHAALNKRLKDVPALDVFTKSEQWVTVVSTTKVLIMPGIHPARSDAALALQLGDIVEVRLGDEKKVDSYGELSQVVRVLCRKADPDFGECSKSNESGLWDEAGKPYELKRR